MMPRAKHLHTIPAGSRVIEVESPDPACRQFMVAHAEFAPTLIIIKPNGDVDVRLIQPHGLDRAD